MIDNGKLVTLLADVQAPFVIRLIQGCSLVRILKMLNIKRKFAPQWKTRILVRYSFSSIIFAHKNQFLNI